MYNTLNSILLVMLLTCSPLAAHTQSFDECMDFLYASMSAPDAADYPRQFYEQNVRATLQAQAEMPWGSVVPHREFMPFVLPLRVNNEHLDESRIVFYDELKERVKGLSMSQAVLEVNHWCHEKVTYTPVTSAPAVRWPPCAPPWGVVARRVHFSWPPYAPWASLPARSIPRDGPTPMTITHG